MCAPTRKVLPGWWIAPRPLSEIIYENEKAKAPFNTPEQQADLRKRLETLAGKIADKTVSHNYTRLF